MCQHITIHEPLVFPSGEKVAAVTEIEHAPLESPAKHHKHCTVVAGTITKALCSVSVSLRRTMKATGLLGQLGGLTHVNVSLCAMSSAIVSTAVVVEV